MSSVLHPLGSNCSTGDKLKRREGRGGGEGERGPATVQGEILKINALQCA